MKTMGILLSEYFNNCIVTLVLTYIYDSFFLPISLEYCINFFVFLHFQNTVKPRFYASHKICFFPYFASFFVSPNKTPITIMLKNRLYDFYIAISALYIFKVNPNGNFILILKWDYDFYPDLISSNGSG